jgi:predicted ABC-type ATPase
MTQPEVILFGGCNGAGKTTLAYQILGKGLQLYDFVNADEIARGLNPLNQTAQAGLASRLAIQRVNELVKHRQSFAFEGTLAGAWQAKILKQCQTEGYVTRLVYVWLPSVTMAQQRVKNRVLQGGHDVAPELIERRYYSGLTNLNHLYLPIVDNALILEGNDLGLSQGYRTIAQKQNGQLQVIQPDKWSQICQPKTV